MSEREQDMHNAHYFALGALHAQYHLTDWETIYELATGFAYFYTANLWRGIAPCWDEYVTDLVNYQYQVDNAGYDCPVCDKPGGH
jgi:hypothetical protein